jgi:hypothetical protein
MSTRGWRREASSRFGRRPEDVACGGAETHLAKPFPMSLSQRSELIVGSFRKKHWGFQEFRKWCALGYGRDLYLCQPWRFDIFSTRDNPISTSRSLPHPPFGTWQGANFEAFAPAFGNVELD